MLIKNLIRLFFVPEQTIVANDVDLSIVVHHPNQPSKKACFAVKTKELILFKTIGDMHSAAFKNTFILSMIISIIYL